MDVADVVFEIEQTDGFKDRFESLKSEFPRLPDAIRGLMTVLRNGGPKMGRLANAEKQIYVAPLADVFGPSIYVAYGVFVKQTTMRVSLIDIYVEDV